MDQDLFERQQLLSQRSLHPRRAIALRRVDAVCQAIGVTATIVSHGLAAQRQSLWEFGAIAVSCMAIISLGIAIRYRWSLARPSFSTRHRATVVTAITWTAGMVLMTILAPLFPNTTRLRVDRWGSYVNWTELVLLIYAAVGLVRGLRSVAAGGVNPAMVLVSSFLFLIGTGTSLLMLPVCRARDQLDVPWSEMLPIALFTSTSASCVTGLVVVNTGTFWSTTGQAVICVLFQIGGLGIMTFGAFFGLAAGRSIQLREYHTMRELMGSEGMLDMRRQIFYILGFTLGAEVLGALLLSRLWGNEDLSRQAGMSLFHSISAFCNAGFSLTPNSFVGWSQRWEVWGVVALLIIIGGLGFTTLDDLGGKAKELVVRSFQRRTLAAARGRTQISITTRIVLGSTLLLLLGGTIGFFVLERTGTDAVPRPFSRDVAHAWFQSVTFRTAGFNTLDLGTLQPATKLMAIGLMFVGASPGSTGGGVKTVAVAVAFLGMLSVLRGRNGIEFHGRSIPLVLVNRALAILCLGAATTIGATMLLVIFEQHPERFLDHLFEATSAAATVGVSTSVREQGVLMSTTQSLCLASRMTLVATMFLGRVGPLTLLLALAGSSSPARYEYPPERVQLG